MSNKTEKRNTEIKDNLITFRVNDFELQQIEVIKKKYGDNLSEKLRKYINFLYECAINNN